MKRTTIGTIIGVSAITGSIFLGGRVLIPVLAGNMTTIETSAVKHEPALIQESFESGRTKLDDLVQSGKLTEIQKNRILTYEKQMISKRDELIKQGLSRTDMQLQMDAIHAELRSYLEKQKLAEVLPDSAEDTTTVRTMGMR